MRKQLRRIRRWANTLVDRDVLIQPSISLLSESHGSHYGGWTILADSLTAESTVISAGLGHDISFDLSLMAKYACCVVGYDPDPKAYAFHDHKKIPSKFVWNRQGISDSSGKMKLYRPPRSDWVSGTLVEGAISHSSEFDEVDIVDVCDLLRTIDGSIHVFKMDIEGAEYGVLDRLLKTGMINRIDQLLVEYHHGKKYRGTDTQKSVDSILNAGFELFSVSAVGCEFSFCRRAAFSSLLKN